MCVVLHSEAYLTSFMWFCLNFDLKGLFDIVISASPEILNEIASRFWRRNYWADKGAGFGVGDAINGEGENGRSDIRGGRVKSTPKFGCLK